MKKFIINIVLGALAASSLVDNAIAQEEQVEQGKVKILEVSSSMMNEFVTPFENLEILAKEEDLKYITKDGNMFYARVPNDIDLVHVMVRGKNTTGASYPLMLLPKDDIPGQHYVLKTTGQTGSAGTVIGGEDESKYATMPYIAMLKELSRDAAKDVLNDGYVKTKDWIEQDFEKGNLYAKSIVKWTGAKLVVEKYSLVNLGHPIVLNEPSFYEEGIKSVSFFPKVKLEKSQSTFLYIIRHREGG